MGFPSSPIRTEPGYLPPEHEPVRQAPLDVWLYAPPRRSAWQRWGRNLLLFALTVLSVFFVGTFQSGNWHDGLLLVVGLLSILLAHEMGHYLAARRYGVDATLPFFIPFPVPLFTLVGTFGAFIRIRSPIPNRKALFDIGVAGPLAGFVVCLPVLWIGIAQAAVVPSNAAGVGIPLGDPLLFQWVAHLVRGAPLPGTTLELGPLGLAAWFGLLVTALNLMPIGQLDGGHVTYALLGKRAHKISIVGSWVAVALIYFGPSWIVWAILMRVLGRRHPPTLDDAASVGSGRAWVGLLALLVFAVSFVPDPIVASWSEIGSELMRLFR